MARFPPLTPEARQRNAARLAAMKGRGQFDHPEFRPLGERCIMSFGSNAGPPMLPNYFYNNNYQIVQTKDHVMILVEMVHDVRVIRMGGERLPKHLRPWMGDSIGRWEGDTLVVETTNFHPLQTFRGASENLKVIERFTRADADTILYKFTIDDPTTFTQPWSGEVPFRPHRRAHLRVRVPRSELRALEHPERRARQGTRTGARRSSSRR